LYPYFVRRYLEQPFAGGLAPWDGAGEKELARDVAVKATV
jgi:hypothetical protein